MFDDEHIDPERDQPIKRVFPYGKDNELYIQKDGPYGYWRLFLKHGPIPSKFSGMYTQLTAAERAAELCGREEKTKREPARPKFKYKSPPPSRKAKVNPDGATATDINRK